MKKIGWTRFLDVRCREATELLSRREDAPLTRPERWGLWLHLRICSGCRHFARQLRQMRSWLRHMGPDAADAGLDPLAAGDEGKGVRLSDEARARIAAALEPREPGNPSPS